MPKLNEILGDNFKSLPNELKDKYKDVDLVDSANYVEKKDLDTANATITQYKKDIKKRDADLVDLQGKVKDNEVLNTEIENLKVANTKASEDYENKLKQMSFETKIEKKLTEFKPKNLGILKKALDFEKISLDGDNFLGLDEQIKTIKESDAYLFEEENKGGTGSIGGGASSLIDQNKGESIGELLAKSKSESQNSEAQKNFFS